MEVLTRKTDPVDSRARLDAVVTFDRDVVVVAGAGTGKTALLTAKMVVYLLGESPRHRPDLRPQERARELLAITFTDKAAGEMGERLVAYLRALLSLHEGEMPADSVTQLVISPLLETYGLSFDMMRERAGLMLEYADAVEISTIHSFCVGLLRSFPIHVGLNPRFAVDPKGEGLTEIVDETWDQYARERLRSLGSQENKAWVKVFDAGVNPHDLRLFVRACVASHIPDREFLDSSRFVGDQAIFESKANDVLLLLETAGRIVRDCGLAKNLNLFKLTDQGPGLVRRLAEGKIEPRERAWLRELADKGMDKLLTKTAVKKLEAHEPSLRHALREMFPPLRAIVACTPEILLAVHEICAPVIGEARARCRREGIVTYDHQLMYASNLLATDPRVVRLLRKRYRLILLDEVQDTDPLQYSIIRPLLAQISHQPSTTTADEAGARAFVVGDPKQSIYLFRNADIQAFHDEVELLREKGALVVDITANFRSTAGIISMVNSMGRRLFERGDYPRELQPEFMPLESPFGPEEPDADVEMIIYGRPDAQEKEKPARHEAVTVEEARVIVARLEDFRREGFEWGDMAVLLPSRTGVDELLFALTHRGIPFLLSGGKTFYQRQEVLDTVHLLEALAFPFDQAALFSFLASPVGGISNDTLVTLCHNGLGEELTYVGCEGVVVEGSVGVSADSLLFQGVGGAEKKQLKGLFETMARLHRLFYETESWEFLAELRLALPVVDAWRLHPQGDQRAANVEKVLQTIDDLVTSGVPMWRAVRRLAREMAVQAESEESTMAAPGMGSVCLETIHGSKGLEYPVVILANLFRSLKTWSMGDVLLARDTRAGGLAVGLKGSSPMRGHVKTEKRARLCNLWAGEYMATRKEREDAERARLLYVALTRAQKKLVMVLPRRDASTETKRNSLANRLFLVLDAAVQADELCPGREFLYGHGEYAKDGLQEKRQDQPGTSFDLTRFAVDLRARHKRFKELSEACSRVRPSSYDEDFPRREGQEAEHVEMARDRALRFGDLCHGILEYLDLDDPVNDLDRVLGSPAALRLAGEMADELLPEAREVLSRAIAAPFFREKICGADKILREVPVLEAVDGATLSGRIDLIACTGNTWRVVDFKTDRAIGSEEELVKRYGHQASAYTGAVQRTLGLAERPSFFLYFLRQCKGVRLEIDE